MKTLVIVFASFFLVHSASAQIVAVDDGGMSGGGGDTPISSPHTVINTAKFATVNLYPFLKNSISPGDSSIDAQIGRKIISTFKEERFEPNGGLYYISKTACIEGDAPHMGGAIIGNTKNPFCLSLPLLQALTPFALRMELGGLIAHELAHQVGYGEADAVHFQISIAKLYQDFDKKQAFHLGAFFDSVDGLIKAVQSNDTVSKICFGAGEVSMSINALTNAASAITESENGSELENSARASTREFWHKLAAVHLETYCGKTAYNNGGWPNPIFVKENDSRDLLQVLNYLMDLYHQWPGFPGYAWRDGINYCDEYQTTNCVQF